MISLRNARLAAIEDAVFIAVLLVSLIFGEPSAAGSIFSLAVLFWLERRLIRASRVGALYFRIDFWLSNLKRSCREHSARLAKMDGAFDDFLGSADRWWASA